jgi:hypothetical protein
LGTTAHLADVVSHSFDLSASLADDQTGARGVKCYANTIPSPLNHHLGNSPFLETLFKITADSQIGMKLISKLALRSIPLGLPVFVDCQAKSDRMYFLSHD